MANEIRIRREKSHLASEKQIAYAQDLLDAMVTRALESGIDVENGYEAPYVRYFQLARLPDDLTSWEASGLIDLLRDSNPRFVFELAQRSVSRRQNGRRIFTGDGQSVLALMGATEYIATTLK